VGRLGVWRACPVAEKTASALEAVSTAMTSFDGMIVIATSRITTTIFDSEGTRVRRAIYANALNSVDIGQLHVRPAARGCSGRASCGTF
jgi:hypothetical protein